MFYRISDYSVKMVKDEDDTKTKAVFETSFLLSSQSTIVMQFKLDNNFRFEVQVVNQINQGEHTEIDYLRELTIGEVELFHLSSHVQGKSDPLHSNISVSLPKSIAIPEYSLVGREDNFDLQEQYFAFSKEYSKTLVKEGHEDVLCYIDDILIHLPEEVKGPHGESVHIALKGVMGGLYEVTIKLSGSLPANLGNKRRITLETFNSAKEVKLHINKDLRKYKEGLSRGKNVELRQFLQQRWDKRRLKKQKPDNITMDLEVTGQESAIFHLHL